jgi:hypothetical protein
METSTNLLLLKAVIFLSRPAAKISHEMIRRGITAYNMQRGKGGSDCKNLKADPHVIHSALKFAGVTMAPKQILFWLDNMKKKNRLESQQKHRKEFETLMDEVHWRYIKKNNCK